MSNHNARLGYGGARRRAENHWDIFDSLPRELRDFLNDAPYRFSAEEAFRFFENNETERFLRTYREYSRRKTIADRYFVWGLEEFKVAALAIQRARAARHNPRSRRSLDNLA